MIDEIDVILLSLITLYTIINTGYTIINKIFYDKIFKINKDLSKDLKKMIETNKKVMEMKDYYKKMYEINKNNLIEVDFEKWKKI